MKKEKDILFLCQFFYPEHNSSAMLPFDTASYLARCGKTIDVLCGYPKEYHFNKDNNIFLRETIDGVKIQRLKYIQSSREGKIGRLINYFSFTAAVLIRLFQFHHYKTIMVYSNPPILPIAAIAANMIFKTKFVFVAYDVYPEVAYASKSLTPEGWIAKIMNRINHLIYKRADMIVALTEEMKQFLLQNRPEITENRICVIENWAHEKCQKATPNVYRKFGYENGQFLVTYFGNMGICQDIDTMLNAIDFLKNHEKIKFLIAGHGSKKKLVKEKIRDNPNVKVMNYLTDLEFEQAMAISSCSILGLEKGLIGTCAPSKYYSYLQSGQPVLAIVEKDSYLAKEVQEEKIGYVIPNGESRLLSKAILNLYNNKEKCKLMGECSRKLYTERYDRSIAMKKYNDLFSKILES